MKNSKGFVLVLLVIAVAFTSLNVIAISQVAGNPIAQAECTAQGDFTPQTLSNQVADQAVETELLCTTGDIKPAPWSDFYPVPKDDDDTDK